MNTLNMPGFTAETSLYKHGTSYRMMAGSNGNDSSGVIPQLPRWLKCAAAVTGAGIVCSSAVTGAGIAACAAATIGATAVCEG
jgi:hypothetical protein